jgi:hypothetical protein
MTIVPPVLMVISFGFSWLVNFPKQQSAAPEPAAGSTPA